MKLKIFSWTLFGLMMVLSLAAFFYVRQEYHTNNVPKNDFYACDFHMRMNEIDCVKRGINPYDVWSMKCEVMPYFPNKHHELWTPERCEFINAYSPWEYVMLMPISCLPRKMAWTIYNYGQLISLIGIAVLSFLIGARQVNNGPLAAAFALFIVFSAMHDFSSGNFCLFITLATLCMAIALNRGHDVIAGLLLAVAMLKPQIGLLYVVPLLLRRRWITCFLAGTLCLMMTCVASFMCHVPIIELLRQSVQGSAFGFHGCGLLPYDIFCLMQKYLLPGTLITIASLGGFALCGLMTSVLKNHSNWFVLLLPASVCALTCNYNNGYNFCVMSLLLLAIAIRLHRGDGKLTTILLLLLTALASRSYDCFVYVINMANGILSRSGIWTSGQIPQEVQWTISSWNATALLVLTIWFVWHIRKSVIVPNDRVR